VVEKRLRTTDIVDASLATKVQGKQALKFCKTEGSTRFVKLLKAFKACRKVARIKKS